MKKKNDAIQQVVVLLQSMWKIKFSYTEHTYNTSCQFNVTVHAMPYSRKYYNIIFMIILFILILCC